MLLFCRNGMHVLRKHELDAFLATAVSPLLHDVETMQEMKVAISVISHLERLHS